MQLAVRDVLARSRPAVESVVELIGDTPLVRLHQLEMKPEVEI